MGARQRRRRFRLHGKDTFGTSIPRLCKNCQPSRGEIDSPLAILPMAHFLMNSAFPSLVARFSFRTKLYIASVPCMTPEMGRRERR